MSCLTFPSVYLSGLSLILLLTGSHAQYYEDTTSAPDYESDYNATFDYSFYSNTSSDDLEKFLREGDGVFDQDQEEEEPHVTMATTQQTTDRRVVVNRNAASLPVCLNLRSLLWILLISLNI